MENLSITFLVLSEETRTRFLISKFTFFNLMKEIDLVVHNARHIIFTP